MSDKKGFILTYDYILSHKTENGGFTDSQIRALGETITRGWIYRASGKWISNENAIIFEEKRPACRHPLRKLTMKTGIEHALEEVRSALKSSITKAQCMESLGKVEFILTQAINKSQK